MGVCGSSQNTKSHLKGTVSKISNFSADSSNSKDFLFYFKNEINPWVKEENVEWKPYDAKIQSDLKQAYNNYLKEAKLNFKVELPSKPGFVFDFKDWNQINKETKDILPFKREYVSLKTNILRKKHTTKYIDYQVNEEDCLPFILDDKVFEESSAIFNEGKEFESIKSTYNFEKDKTMKRVYFSVIQDIDIELKLREELCFLENGYKLSLPFNEFIEILKDEIQNLAKLLKKEDNASKAYFDYLNQMTNSFLFFNKIIQMFMIDGFLQQKMNQFLRLGKSNYYENFKLFYISLLASLKYCADNSPIPNHSHGNDILIYGSSKPNPKETEIFNARENSYFSLMIREFSLCSRNKNIVKKNMKLEDESTTEYLWEILVPNYILDKEKENLAFIETILPSPNNEEVLIRSGGVIFIDKIIPYTENKNGINVEIKNKFILKGILRSFSFNSLYEALKIYYFYRNVNLKMN